MAFQLAFLIMLAGLAADAVSSVTCSRDSYGYDPPVFSAIGMILSASLVLATLVSSLFPWYWSIQSWGETIEDIKGESVLFKSKNTLDLANQKLLGFNPGDRVQVECKKAFLNLLPTECSMEKDAK